MGCATAIILNLIMPVEAEDGEATLPLTSVAKPAEDLSVTAKTVEV